MTTDASSADADRDEFRRRARASSRLLVDGDADASNRETEGLEAVASRWGEEVAGLLSPLLDAAEETPVRYSAASLLLHRGHAADALPVLDEITQTMGPEALSAKLLVHKWRKQNA